MKSSQVTVSTGKIINNQYITSKKISQGSFGVVFVGEELSTKMKVAIKIEKTTTEDLRCLNLEVEILKHLQGLRQIPTLFWNGQENNTHIVVMTLLGHDLTHYVKRFRQFSLKCILNVADQMLNVLEQVHIMSVVHRDLKPENIIIGRDGEADRLYLVDFGISKFYKNKEGLHVRLNQGRPFVGTSRYASIAAHNGDELSRKDDLESLGYVLIYLMCGSKNQYQIFIGSLPWQAIQSRNDDEKIQLVGNMKESILLKDLCKDIPVEFCHYMEYARNLGFKNQPDYKFLRGQFRKLFKNSNFQNQDQIFDWSDSSKGDRKKKKNMSQYSNLNNQHSNQQLQQSQVHQSTGRSSLFKPSSKSPRKQTSHNSMISLDGGNSRKSKKSTILLDDSYSDSSLCSNASILIGFQGSVFRPCSNKMTSNMNFQTNTLPRHIDESSICSKELSLIPLQYPSKDIYQSSLDYNGDDQDGFGIECTPVNKNSTDNLLKKQDFRTRNFEDTHPEKVEPSMTSQFDLNFDCIGELDNKYEMLIQKSVSINFKSRSQLDIRKGKTKL